MGPQMADETTRRCLVVAIDRATRMGPGFTSSGSHQFQVGAHRFGVYSQRKPNKTAAPAKAFPNALHKASPIRITKLLTDNGKEFADRLFGFKDRQPTGQHEFDQRCGALGIEHCLPGE